MKRLRLFLWMTLIAWPLLLVGQGVSAPGQVIVTLKIHGGIGPATGDYLRRGLEQAKSMNAALVVVQINTPGGLYSTTRDITQDIMASSVPVATYVAPSGAHAASAGTYIMLASHIAAMAPATNVGSATPISMDGSGSKPARDEQTDKKDKDDKKEDSKPRPPKPGAEEKAMNDAVAYIRGLAGHHGRNVAWAERAVREAANLTAEDAVRQNVADFIAVDLADLLKKADGRRVKLGSGEVKLSIKGLEVVHIEPDWRNRFLSVITDPQIAVLLMTLGMAGLFFELMNPGYVLPGVIGGICLLIALYATQVLPVNYAGVALILLGIAFMIAEAFAPSFGILGIGGVIAFIVGSVIFYDGDAGGFGLSWPFVITMALTSAAFFIGIGMLVLKSRDRVIVSGAEELRDARGEALDSFKDAGRVRVRGEEWQARTRTPIKRGERVKVVGRDGLILLVEPFTESK